mmetsp:Transcript_9610/g.23954  ORF Transcript_9610/g.23954 Transcript_9610/m.23954 type:complete len:356 (-) Transcript_9610:129-1196(-)
MKLSAVPLGAILLGALASHASAADVAPAPSAEQPAAYAGVEVIGHSDAPQLAVGEEGAFAPALPGFAFNAVGEGTPLDFAVTAAENDAPISYWHDIPAFAKQAADGEPLIVNFVAEIPKGEIGKLEIIKEIEGNPIKFDRKDVKNMAGEVLYERPRFVAYGASPYTYGAIPQTWENSLEADPVTGITGDNDPIDAYDIGSAVAETGAVYQAKVLGALGLIDDDETDWKVIVINANDPDAAKYDSVEDLPEEVKERVFTYVRDKPTAVGDPPSVFWPDLTDAYAPGVWKGKDETKAILDHTAEAYQKLVGDCALVKELEFAFPGCEEESSEDTVEEEEQMVVTGQSGGNRKLLGKN